MWQAQWQHVPAFLTQIDWPNCLAIVGPSSAQFHRCSVDARVEKSGRSST
jgi:hypothetical protein